MPLNSLNPNRNIHSTRTVQLLILLVLSAVVINGALFFHLMRQNKESMRKKMLNEKAMILTRKILGNIKDAEMGQRGYILTGRSKYLLPYTSAVKVISAYQFSLTNLIKNHFSADNIITDHLLNNLINSKLAELKNTISLKNQGKEDFMLKVINSDAGEDEMDQIRKICNSLLTTFYNNLSLEDQKVSKTLSITEVSIAIFSILVIIVIFIMRIKLYNRRRKNIRLFEELELKNSKLITQQQELKGLSMDFSARNSELEHFTHIISHDLRGPLNNIISLIQLLEDEVPPDETVTNLPLMNSEENDHASFIVPKKQMFTSETHPIFKMLKNASLGLFHKLDDLIILLRQRQGGLLLKESISLSQLLGEVKANHKMEIDRSGTLIEADFIAVDELLFVKIYMQSILQNLIRNAIKYRDPLRSNNIILKTYSEGDTIRLMISDNGRGINMEKYGSEIFGLFKTFHTEEDSHGVGLYLVKKQIIEMSGSITVQSEIGKGTTFNIVLPA